MDSKLYRVNGRTMTKEQFTSELSNILFQYRFATIDQLAVMLKARRTDVAEILNDYIISFAKAKGKVTMYELCNVIGVRRKYVLDLIAAGRLEELSSCDVSMLKDVEERAIEYNNAIVEQIKKTELLGALQGAVKTTPSTPNEGPKLTYGFHSSYLKKR